MLALFGQDYAPTAITEWLLSDLSFCSALAVMLVVYLIGRGRLWTKTLVAPVFSSLLPFSLWIWDIPFSGRYICRRFHDGRFLLVSGWPLNTGYFVVLGLTLYVFFVVGIIRKMKKRA